MVVRRALVTMLGIFFVAITGCSGGGGGSAPKPAPTSTPTQAPTLGPTGPPTPTPMPIVTATPTPMPTQPPSGSAIANTARPLHNNDAYAYSGTTQQTFVYSGTSPKPSSSTLSTVKQNVAVTSNATYNGTSGLYDFKTTETDTSSLQTLSITTDTYYGTLASAGMTYLIDYGYASSDSNGEKFSVTSTNPGPLNGLIDVLPETSGAAWSNSGAQSIAQSESSGFNASRTYAADGSYTDTSTYPQASAARPTAAPLVATISTNADGSATYSLPLFGPPNVTVAYSAPASSNGAISIVLSQPGPTPQSTPSVIQSASVGAWFQQPLRLYQELDRDNGAVAIPAACNVSSSFGGQANEIEQKSVRVDPVLGTLDSFDQLSYVVPITGVVCVQLQDRTLTYYDYSGQGNAGPTGISFAGGNSPFETATLATTIGLAGATIQPLSLRRSSVETESGLRLANARANFLSTVEHRRIAAERRVFDHLQTMIRERIAR